MFMPKQPVSVTLDRENLLWLRARVARGRRRSLSDALDELITQARREGPAGDARSVVGTVDIAADDPGLERADAFLQAEFDASLERSILAREDRPAFDPAGAPRRKPRRG
jgi:Arc/MetJ-type ribon-helix-helix transcriptional regulator